MKLPAPQPIAAHKSRMVEAHNAGLLRMLARRVSRLQQKLEKPD
jgi:hypothetical protein